jgi:hypothetical protein
VSRTFTIDRTPPLVDLPTARGLDGMVVRVQCTGWDNLSLTGFHVQLARDTAFTQMVLETDVGLAGVVEYGGSPGETYYARAYAVDCAGNQSAYSARSNPASFDHLADLEVPQVQAPDFAYSGQTMQVAWTVADSGLGATNVPQWYDDVYLSPTPGFDPGTATYLKRVQNLTSLSPGEAYSNEALVTLPRGFAGTYYVFVFADHASQVPETDNGNNSGVSEAVAVTLSDYADLTVPSMAASPTAYSGEPITVSWTVTNEGTGRSDGDHWWDTVFLSADSLFNYEACSPGYIRVLDQPLGRRQHVGALEPESSYVANMAVTLPDGIYGRYYVYVTSDLSATSQGQTVLLMGEVFENVSELNISPASPVDVTLTPPANLVMGEVTAGATGWSGGTVPVTWQVSNLGFNPTKATGWTDRIYFSADTVYDAGDRLMGAVGHSGVLGLDEGYEGQANVALPRDLSGSYWVFVRTDADGAVWESDEDDNRGRAPGLVVVTLTPWPDLQVTEGSVVAEGEAGETVPLSWTVSNWGAGSAGGQSWTDRVYVSSEPNWGGSLRALTAQGNPAGLESGESYTRTTTMKLPTDLSGTQYVYVIADASNRVYEHTDNGNNGLEIGTLEVTPYPPVDLEVTEVTAPDSSASGRSVTVSWTVENVGSGTTLSSSWSERVYLSADSLLDGSDLLLKSVVHGGSLEPGESCAGQASATLANGFSGTYWVIVRTDPSGATGDGNPSNNVRLSPHPLVVELTPAPDLVATSIETAVEGVSGQPVSVHWRVENQGVGPLVPERWAATCYLSVDAVLDGSDYALASVSHTGPLDPGEGVDDTVEVTLPSWASGPFYVFVRADSRNEVYEAWGEGNNTERTQILVQVAAPADLVVQDVVVPMVGIPGEMATVSWTLANVGTNPAIGRVWSAVYVSPDTTFEVEDPVLALEAMDINLPPGAQQRLFCRVTVDRAFQMDAAGNVTATLPGVAPGAYYGIVRTNVRSSIREETASNNAAASAETIHVEVATLELGVPQLATLQAGESRYYRVETPPELDLTIGVTSDAADATNELYAAFGVPPSLVAFDYAGPAEFTSAPDILIPATQAGAYYVLLTARSLPLGVTAEQCTVRANALPLSLTSVEPVRVGRLPRVTTVVRGAGLRDTTRLSLWQGGTRVVEPDEVQWVNTTELRARWDLTSVLENAYNLHAETSDTVVVLPNAHIVEEPTALEVVTTPVKPDMIRENSTTAFTFRYLNTSNGDLPALKVRLLYPATAQLVNLGTSEGLWSWSQLYPERFVPIAGDAFAAQDSASGRILQVVDLLAVDVPPGAEHWCTLTLKGFEHNPFSVRSLTEVSDRLTFLRRELNRIEAARQVLLAAPTGRPAALIELASEAEAFADTVLQQGYVARGILDTQDLSEYLVQYGALVGGESDEPAGPAELLAALEGDTSCTVQDAVPECRPAETPLTTSLPACAVCFLDSLPVVVVAGEPETVLVAQGLTVGYSATASADSRVVSPCDPNLMTGPIGFGTERWVGLDAPLSYRVDFENLSEIATAPAQVVQVRVPIDESLELSTFRLGSFGFGTHTINVPPNRTTYTVEPYYADLGLNVRVTAGVDVTQREAVWTFTSIDPATNAPPTNPLVGFLPVNDPYGRGQGFAHYTIRARTDIPSGTPVEAQADITFDVNAPISTNIEANQVDAGRPWSALQPEVEILSTTTVRLSWTGTDDATGLRDMALYCRDDQGDSYELLLAHVTSDTVTLMLPYGHRYRFYGMATDNAGNVEAAKRTSEAYVTFGPVAVDTLEGSLPKVFALHPSRPNPFHGQALLRFDLPVAKQVSMEVFDVAGRRVAVPLEPKTLQPGRHSILFRPDRLESGVYFCRMRAGRFEQTQKMLLIR